MKVGLQTLNFSDPNRRNWQNTGARPLVTDMWYPADKGTREVEILVGPPDTPFFDAGLAAREAEVAAGKFPLILLSHGTGGSAMSVGWLGTALARAGNIVAGLNHHGNTALEEYTLEGFAHVWERARDATEVLTQLLAHPTFGPQIDRERIGAAGFSLGGFTVIALAGGRADLKTFQEVYKMSGRRFIDDVPPEFPDRVGFTAYFEKLAETNTEHKQSFRDERIKAGFAIAPVLGEAFTAEGLAPIEIPIMMVVGEADPQAKPEWNARHFAKWIRGAELTVLPAPVAHYTFLDVCTDFGKEKMANLCVDAPGVDRAAVHGQVAEMAREFFSTQLGQQDTHKATEQ